MDYVHKYFLRWRPQNTFDDKWWFGVVKEQAIT